MFIIFRILVFVLIFYVIYRFLAGSMGGGSPQFSLLDMFSSTKRCSRCDGKGWWQNTRNREKCEWCKGSGRLPKDFPTNL
ncbi:MAG: hypothetical protein MRZ79_22095 [Bacteroidia bacterium]|nr:hypothetical protein [Bacteroidia bacterium]